MEHKVEFADFGGFESIAGEFRKTGEFKIKTGEFVNGVRWRLRWIYASIIMSDAVIDI